MKDLILKFVMDTAECNSGSNHDHGNCEEELPKKPVGRQTADRRPTGFPQNIDYQSADSRPTVGDVSVRCR